MPWGCLQDTNVAGDVILLSDFHPRSQEVCDSFAPASKKCEVRGKQPDALDTFLRCANQHIGVWCVFYGKEHKEERIHALAALGRIHEARPELFTLRIIVCAWGEMARRYIAAVKEGARKMVRMLPETVRKGEFRRKALTPMSDGRSRWGYPTTFLMEHPAGYWQSLDIPRLEEKVSRSTWQTFLVLQPKRPAAGGNEDHPGDMQPEQEVRLPNDEYPAGHPLSDAERKACRNHRYKSTSDGRYL